MAQMYWQQQMKCVKQTTVLALRKSISWLRFNDREFRWVQHCCSEWVQEIPNHFFFTSVLLFCMGWWALVPSTFMYFIFKSPSHQDKTFSSTDWPMCQHLLFLLLQGPTPSEPEGKSRHTQAICYRIENAGAQNVEKALMGTAQDLVGPSLAHPVQLCNSSDSFETTSSLN